MRRGQLGEQADRREVKALLKQKNPGWKQTRLTVLLMAFSSENTVEKIAQSTGVSSRSVNRWLLAFRRGGIEEALSRGTDTNHRPKKSDDEVIDYLKRGLEAQRWNTLVEATEELSKHFNKTFKYKTVWVWTKKCAGVLRIPRPVHEKRDPAKAESFKDTFLDTLLRQPVCGSKPVKVWFADESRYGLLPNLRRVWTMKGVRPLKKWKSEYKWSYCYGAIDVIDGKSVFLQTPTVNLQWTEQFLLQIKKQYPEHEHIVVWDGAGFHPQDSSHERVPEDIHVIKLPPYSPELNPIEKLWDLIQDHTSNKLWPTIERLDQVVAMHLRDWIEDPMRVLGLVGNGWISASANDSNNLDCARVN